MLPILTTPAFASACQACSRASCCSRVACDCCLSRKAPRASRLSPSRSLPAVQRFRLDRIIAPGSCGGSGESYFPNILRLLQDVHKTQHKTELDVSEQYASARAHTPPLPPPAHAFSSPARSFSSATPHAPPSLRRRRSVSFRSRTPQQRWYDGTREPAVRGRGQQRHDDVDWKVDARDQYNLQPRPLAPSHAKGRSEDPRHAR